MSQRFPAARHPAPGERIQLAPDVSHHLLRVCRLPRGGDVILFDGRGWQCRARLVDVRGERAVMEGLSPPTRPADAAPLVLIQGLPKRPAWETTLRMATELGATELRPFLAARSTRRPLREDRWVRILQAAAGQCGRGDLPKVRSGPDLEGVLADLPDVERLILLPGEPRRSRPVEGTILLVGPEGGLTIGEIDRAVSAGFQPAGLGTWTLRADTAAAAALALYAPTTRLS